MGALNVKIGGKIFPIEQLIGKTIYAANTAPLYPYAGGKALFQVPAGGVIGKMYSWTTGSDGSIYLTFYTTSSAIKAKYANGYYVVKLSDVDGSTIQKQGGKTTEQILEEEKDKDKTVTDKIMDTVLKAVIGAAAVWGLTSVIKSKV